MRAAVTILLIALIGSNGLLLNAQDAPIATIGEVVSSDTTALVPITVTGFSNISVCDLAINYDPEIADAISVTLGPGVLNNFFIADVDVPGTIIIAWFYFQGLTIPDDSVFLYLVFERTAYGSSAIEFDNSLPNNCIWGDTSSNELNDIPHSTFYIDGSVTFEMVNAPVTSAPVVEGCQGSAPVDIPVIVTDFFEIGAFKLTMQFDTLSFSYQSFTNESGFPGLDVMESYPGSIEIDGFSDSLDGITLENNSVLCVLHFHNLGGSTAITWYDDGGSCEFSGPAPDYEPLNDTPQSVFYIDGYFHEIEPPVINVQPVSPDTIIAGNGIADFSVTASGEDLTYQWQEYIDDWDDVSDGGVYSGATTSLLTITDPPAAMDGYHYRCIVTGSCEPPAISDGEAKLSLIVVTGFDNPLHNEYPDQNCFDLWSYPNPFSDQITFSYSAPSEGTLKVEITSINGEKVANFSKNIDGKEDDLFTFSTQRLLSGMYVVSATFSGKGATMRTIQKIVSNNK